ncbi:MAG: hypothetical protein AAF357_00515, partial [Verrucomicrobiota bacterium]
MMVRWFQYRLPCEGQPDDLNQWLATHRVVSIQHHLVPANDGATWLVFVVEATGANPGRSPSDRR